MDKVWWDVHAEEVNANFSGAKFSISTIEDKHCVTKLPKFNAYGNSGAGAISLAVQGDATRIILLGYDCQKTGDKAHWHGDHPPQLGNAQYIDKWLVRFEDQARAFKDIDIINCSRQTALTCYKRGDLDEILDCS